MDFLADSSSYSSKTLLNVKSDNLTIVYIFTYLIHTISAVLFPARLVRKACTVIYTSYQLTDESSSPAAGEHLRDDDL